MKDGERQGSLAVLCCPLRKHCGEVFPNPLPPSVNDVERNCHYLFLREAHDSDDMHGAFTVAGTHQMEHGQQNF